MNDVLNTTTALTQPATAPTGPARGEITQKVISIMKAGRDLPMATVCAEIALKLDMSMSYARAWYRDFVSREIAPGKIEKAPSRAETRKLLGLPEPVKPVKPVAVTTPTPVAEAAPPAPVVVEKQALTDEQKKAIKNAKARARAAAKKAEGQAAKLAA